jgi:integrase
MASMYQRGQIWWAKWYQEGQMIRQSLRTRDKTEARRRLREREAQVVRCERTTALEVTWEDTAADLLAYYRAYGTRDATEANYRVKKLTEYFRGMPLTSIDSQSITGYVVHRKAQGMAAATINVDLATLRRALRLAHEHGKLDKVPIIRTLRPAQPRSGFFERDQFEAVRAALPDDLALVVTIAFVYGWRIDSEVLTLAKGQVDLQEGTLRLQTSKNGAGRVVYLTLELRAGILNQLARVKALERETGQIVPWLFPWLRGPYRGRPIKSFVRSWRRACQEARCPGMLRHDLRRTAARNMVNLGVPERVVMAVTGHKTASMLHRYCIVSPGDLQDVARRLQTPTRPVQNGHMGG